MIDTQPAPALLNGTVTVNALMSDEMSNIASAEFSLDGGVTWPEGQQMSAQDGASFKTSPA